MDKQTKTADVKSKDQLDKPLKAYMVLETCENTGGIVFARRDIEARKRGSCEFADGDISSVSCKRAPWADIYADTQRVPISEAVLRGWRYECCCCGAMLTEDWMNEQGLPLAGMVGFMDSIVFCCAECEANYAVIKETRKQVGQDFLATLRDMILKRFGPVEFVEGDTWEHVYVIDEDGAYSVGQAFVSFDFPGRQHGPASLKYYWPSSYDRNAIGPVKPYYLCSHGDKETFEAFAAETKARIR